MSEHGIFAVLGAYGGIGSALSRRLARSGKRLVLAGRNKDRLEALSKELDAEGTVLNAAFAKEVDGWLRNCVEVHGRLDAVACCTGSLLLKPAHLTREAEWDAVIDDNLTAAFNTVRSAARAMNDTGGSIVLVSSAAARVGLANHEAIAAVKAGIIGLTLASAASYASRGIRVNCVAPGMVDTPLTSRLTSNESALKASEAMHALGRIGTAEEVASAIDWLMDPAQSWVTGQVLGVDGGLGSVRPQAMAQGERRIAR